MFKPKKIIIILFSVKLVWSRVVMIENIAYITGLVMIPHSQYNKIRSNVLATHIFISSAKLYINKSRSEPRNDCKTSFY